MPVPSILQAIYPAAKSKDISDNLLVKTGQGVVIAIIVGSHTNGTIKLWDNTSAGVAVCMHTYTYATGSQVIPLWGLPFTTGLFATTNGTTQASTILYQ